jgi:hypothetical protein
MTEKEDLESRLVELETNSKPHSVKGSPDDLWCDAEIARIKKILDSKTKKAVIAP